MDIGSIAALLSSLRSASDIAKGMMTLRNEETFRLKAIELTQAIMTAQQGALSAQADQSAQAERIRVLEGRLAAMESWAKERQRYQLVDYGCGTFAYALKADAANGEPPHRICPTCFNQGKKSLLQSSTRSDGRELTLCFTCKTQCWLGCGPRDRQTRAITSVDPWEG